VRVVLSLETSALGIFAVGGAIGEGAQVVAALHAFLGEDAAGALI
jgi:hypothetical protein